MLKRWSRYFIAFETVFIRFESFCLWRPSSAAGPSQTEEKRQTVCVVELIRERSPITANSSVLPDDLFQHAPVFCADGRHLSVKELPTYGVNVVQQRSPLTVAAWELGLLLLKVLCTAVSKQIPIRRFMNQQ